MPQNDAFALKNSGLNPFLFADVGIEQNGSRLTVLSILGRLGKDPWAQAAEWAKMPNAAKIDGLAHSISQMPLSPHELAEARVIAGRLVMLLPRLTGAARQTASRAASEVKIPEWLPILTFVVVLGLAIVATRLSGPTTPAPATPAAQSIERGD